MLQMCAWKSLRAAKHLHVHIQSACLVADVDDLWPACAPLLLTSLAMTDSAATADIHRSRRCPLRPGSEVMPALRLRLHQDAFSSASRRLTCPPLKIPCHAMPCRPMPSHPKEPNPLARASATHLPPSSPPPSSLSSSPHALSLV
jgi:hypothetical protein